MTQEFRAYHEGGHAVIAHAFGCRLVSVHIQSDAATNSGGCCTYEVRPVQYKAYIQQPDGSFRTNTRGKRLAILAAAQRDAVIAWAGCETLAHLSVTTKIPLDRREWSASGYEDWKRLESISQEAFGKFNERWLAKRELDTKRLIWIHWDAIERLAAALFESETLTGKEAVAIIGSNARREMYRTTARLALMPRKTKRA
jgi:hypothetical protein